LRALSPGVCFYRVAVRIERNGRYRVVVVPDSAHAEGISGMVRIRVH